MLKPLKDIIPIIEESLDGYYEVYKDAEDKIIKKVWHAEKKLKRRDVFEEEHEEYKTMKFKSKEQWDKEKPKFPLLPQEDYELVISDLEKRNQPRYMPKKNQSTTEDVVNFTLEVVGLKDGSEAVDVDGGEAKGRKMFFTARPESMGWRQSGEPSITRSFVAFTTGQDVNGELELESWEQLLGKSVFAEIIQKVNTKGNNVNKISRILPPPKRKK